MPADTARIDRLEQELAETRAALVELGEHVVAMVGFGMKAPNLQAIVDDVKAVPA